MVLRFTVLASGSGGNASVVATHDFGVLLDAGLGPRQIAARLADVGLSWHHLHAAVLTHTHGDHWKEATLRHLQRRCVRLHCHEGHRRHLTSQSPAFVDLDRAGLVHTFQESEEIRLSPDLRCRPLPVAHDSGATFGFRFDGLPNLFGHAASLGYTADLGTWDDALACALADVDLLALEFNHDEAMERSSGRAPHLIARVLGDEGHLSNDQATALLRAVLNRSAAGRLRHVVQLHLSRECNRPALARAAAASALGEDSAILVHTAEQDSAGSTLELGGSRANSRPRAAARMRSRRVAVGQMSLPGFAD